MGESGWDPARYPAEIREEIERYDELQRHVAEASADVDAGLILELGTGTGETARLLLELHPSARLVGVDGNRDMLATASGELPAERVELRLGRLQDELPAGPFDLVVSALAVHHLDGEEKELLFRRVADALRPGGRFVLGDVVVPERPEDAVIELEEGFDRPDTAAAQLAGLSAAGLRAELVWARQDLAVLRADLPR